MTHLATGSSFVFAVPVEYRVGYEIAGVPSFLPGMAHKVFHGAGMLMPEIKERHVADRPDVQVELTMWCSINRPMERVVWPRGHLVEVEVVVLVEEAF